MCDNPQGEKIQKVLAWSGACSRRSAEQLILDGRVTLNGQTVTDPAIRVDPGRDSLEVDGRPLPTPPAGVSALILYKKIGYVTSKADPHNTRTVYNLLPPGERSHRWLYAGRLDKDSEGLVLFTDSGELVQRLTHPSFKIEKHYTVRVRGNPGADGLVRMERGMKIDGVTMKVERVKKTGFSGGEGTYELVLTQGEKRQIKRMFEQIGCEVRYLCRNRMGPVSLKGLAPGQSRRLTDAEIERLVQETYRREKQARK